MQSLKKLKIWIKKVLCLMTMQKRILASFYFKKPINRLNNSELDFIKKQIKFQFVLNQGFLPPLIPKATVCYFL